MFARYDEETPAFQYIYRHESQYHDGKQTCAIEQTDDGQFEVYCHECPFSVSEVAEMYDTDPRTVRYWCESGVLAAHKFAGVWAIDEAALETFERPKMGRPIKESTMEQNSRYIGSWEIYTATLQRRLQERLDAGKVAPTDTVWCGPSGDAFVGPAPEDEEYVEYLDEGTVAELLAE